MPAKSKSQYQLMAGVCSGSITGSGIPRGVACEYVRKTGSPRGLPDRAPSDCSRASRRDRAPG